MSEQQQYEADYKQGFNEGYIIAQHLPDLSDQLAQVESEAPRIEGLKDGGKQFVLEQVKTNRPKWMQHDTHKPDKTTPDKNKDIEPDK